MNKRDPRSDWPASGLQLLYPYSQDRDPRLSTKGDTFFIKAATNVLLTLMI